MRLQDYIVTEDTPMIEVMKKINENASGNAFICDDGVLLAAVTDGDIRRSIMKNVDIMIPISQIANYSPLSVSVKEKSKAMDLMREKVITALPIVDEKNKIVEIKFLLKKPQVYNNKIDLPIVIMAGGKGTRLKPYTDILPKPLIPIGDKTITEHIMEHFERYGCNRFHMIVNYKKNFIKSYFSDSERQRDIIFTEEEDFLGTGGGLKLLQDKIRETFFLTNCDIIVEADYEDIVKLHKEKGNIITLVCAKKKIVIPYGTVEVNEAGYVEYFKEKPDFEFHTNTGLYVIEPAFLDKIEAFTFLPITDIIQKCIDEGEHVGTYLIEEDNWMDMGQLEELEKMREKIGI